MHTNAQDWELKLTAYANMQGNKKTGWTQNREHMWACTWMVSGMQIICVCALKAEVLEFKDFIFTRSFTEPGTRTLGQN